MYQPAVVQSHSGLEMDPGIIITCDTHFVFYSNAATVNPLTIVVFPGSVPDADAISWTPELGNRTGQLFIQ
jgi:hypothetical protein